MSCFGWCFEETWKGENNNVRSAQGSWLFSVALSACTPSHQQDLMPTTKNCSLTVVVGRKCSNEFITKYFLISNHYRKQQMSIQKSSKGARCHRTAFLYTAVTVTGTAQHSFSPARWSDLLRFRPRSRPIHRDSGNYCDKST